MSSSLAPVPVGEDALLPSPQTWNTMLQMASELVKSGLLPGDIKTPAAALAVIQKGRELGIPPMAAMAGIAVIKGKPTCSAELMLALIRRDHGPQSIRVKETTNEACTVEWRDTGWGEAPRSYTFTIQDAQRAELMANPTWKKYPAAMLRARCISAVARMAFPECIGGMHTADELGAVVEVTSDGEVIPVTAAPVNLREVHGTAPPDAPSRINQTQMDRLHAAANRWKYDHEAVHASAAARFGVESVKDLTGHEAAQEITWWETTPPEAIHERMAGLLAPDPETVPAAAEIVDVATGEIIQPTLDNTLLDFETKIRDAKTRRDLAAVGQEIAQAGIKDEGLRESFRRADKALELQGR